VGDLGRETNSTKIKGKVGEGGPRGVAKNDVHLLLSEKERKKLFRVPDRIQAAKARPESGGATILPISQKKKKIQIFHKVRTLTSSKEGRLAASCVCGVDPQRRWGKNEKKGQSAYPSQRRTKIRLWGGGEVAKERDGFPESRKKKFVIRITNTQQRKEGYRDKS